MTLKQFKIIKLLVVIALAVLVSQSVIYRNYLWPIMGMALAALLLFYFRGKVKGIIADERDYEIGGKAARWTIQLSGWVASVVMIIFYAQRDLNPAYEIIASVLAYAVCFILIIYALIFRYYQKIALLEKKTIYIVLGLLLIIILIVAGLRIFSGEDDWICKNGQWIKHGQPGFPAPSIECN